MTTGLPSPGTGVDRHWTTPTRSMDWSPRTPPRSSGSPMSRSTTSATSSASPASIQPPTVGWSTPMAGCRLWVGVRQGRQRQRRRRCDRRRGRRGGTAVAAGAPAGRRDGCEAGHDEVTVDVGIHQADAIQQARRTTRFPAGDHVSPDASRLRGATGRAGGSRSRGGRAGPGDETLRRDAHSVSTRAFVDHFGFVEKSFDEWHEGIESSATHDWAQLRVAYLDGVPVAMVRGSDQFVEDEDRGYIATVAVLARARGQALPSCCSARRWPTTSVVAAAARSCMSTPTTRRRRWTCTWVWACGRSWRSTSGAPGCRRPDSTAPPVWGGSTQPPILGSVRCGSRKFLRPDSRLFVPRSCAAVARRRQQYGAHDGPVRDEAQGSPPPAQGGDPSQREQQLHDRREGASTRSPRIRTSATNGYGVIAAIVALVSRWCPRPHRRNLNAAASGRRLRQHARHLAWRPRGRPERTPAVHAAGSGPAPTGLRYAVMRIAVDLTLCQGYAQCAFLAPDVFRFVGHEALMYVPEPDDARASTCCGRRRRAQSAPSWSTSTTWRRRHDPIGRQRAARRCPGRDRRGVVGRLRTAEALRACGHGGAIMVIGDEEQPPYDRPPLSKQVLVGFAPATRDGLAQAP